MIGIGVHVCEGCGKVHDTIGAYLTCRESHQPQRCPCGHDVDSDLRCLNGRIYGPCASEHCDGPCTDTYGDCSSDGCLCQDDG